MLEIWSEMEHLYTIYRQLYSYFNDNDNNLNQKEEKEKTDLYFFVKIFGI